MINNLILVKINPSEADVLAQALQAEEFLGECGALQREKHGFLRFDSGDMVRRVGGAGDFLFQLCIEKKLLPAAVIREWVKVRAQEVEERQGYKPGRKQMRELKLTAEDELLPRAFSVKKTVLVWVSPKLGTLGVVTTSMSVVDAVTTLLSRCVSGIAMAPIKTRHSPQQIMSALVNDDLESSLFSVDDECRMVSPNDEGGIRFTRHRLDSPAVRHHLSSKTVSELAMTWNNRVSLVLTSGMTLKKIRMLDVVTAESEADSMSDEFEVNALIEVYELNRLIPDLLELLGGEEVGA